MKLITKAIESHLHRNYRLMRAAEENGKEFDPLVPLKLFMPETDLSFYIVDIDPADPDRLYGFVTGLASTELGYFSLAELEGLRSPQLGLGIERDAWWPNIKLSTLREKILHGMEAVL